MRVLVIGALLATSAMAGNFPTDWADIRLQGRNVVARPGLGHAVSEQVMEIVESDGCAHRNIGETQIEVLGACTYLSGVYRYVYQPKTDTVPHHVAVGFTLSLPRPESKVFLVSSPWDLRAPSR